MEDIISVLIDATLSTSVLVVAAFGLAIIFGLVGVINLGHGAMLTLGSYLTWQGTQVGLPFVFAVLVGAAGVGLIGFVFEVLVVRHLYDRLDDTLLITWGFFLVSTEMIKIVFGTSARSVRNPLPGAIKIGGIDIPQYRVALALVALALILGTAMLFYRTDFGIKVRAMIQNRDMASLLGVDVGRMYRLVFALGAAFAGLAGGLLAPMTSIEPYAGSLYLVRSFFVVITGGVGHILGGTMVGSVVIGGSESVFALFTEQIFAQTVVFALAVLLLRFWPSGLLAPRGRGPR